MPLKIDRVEKNSLAHKSKFSNEDTIISINGNEINDFIDLQFYSSEQYLQFMIERDGKLRRVLIENDWENILGIEPEEHHIKRCHNKCIFCFIDQMPPALRDTLYVKDDDFLFSFVFGNYISTNNMKQADFERIVEQRITPLYISIHTTNPILRKKIMGYKKDYDVLEKLRYLADNDISYHTQIVLMPGINDGKELISTLDDLMQEELQTLSVGIVPVGLTKFRDKLYYLEGFTNQSAAKLLRIVNDYRIANNCTNIYPSDEFYLLAGVDIPDTDYYDDFCQIENGIGMIAATADNWKRKKRKFVKNMGDKSIAFITGTLSSGFISKIAADMNSINKTNQAIVLPIVNEAFGKAVTVTGLLTYQDIKQKLDKLTELPGILAFSSNTFNDDGVTLDGIHFDKIKEETEREILIVNELWNDWFFV